MFWHELLKYYAKISYFGYGRAIPIRKIEALRGLT